MIPIEEWIKIEAQLQELMEYASIISGLKEAFTELREILKGNKKGENAKVF